MKGGLSKEVVSDEGEFSMGHMCICSQYRDAKAWKLSGVRYPATIDITCNH